MTLAGNRTGSPNSAASSPSSSVSCILCGSVYLILGTNIGARLGFLVAFAGARRLDVPHGRHLVDLRHRPARPGPVVEAGGRVRRAAGCRCARRCRRARSQRGRSRRMPTPNESAEIVRDTFLAQGWEELDKAAPAFGQAQSAATEILIEEEAFAAGEFEVVDVFDNGGERYPKFDDALDFLAFWHTPHYSSSRRPRSSRCGPSPVERPSAPRDRREPPARVRVHGPRPRRSPPAAGGAADRWRLRVPGLC